MSPFEVQLRRDLRLGWAGRGDMAVMLGFFLIILTLVPLAVGPDAAFLQPIAVPMIWIAAMLSSLAGFTRIFSEDVRCGWVDQVALSPLPLPLYVIAKAATHWVIGAVPMLLATPLMALMLYMDTSHLPALLLALVLGTGALTLLGVIGAARATGLTFCLLCSLLVRARDFPTERILSRTSLIIRTVDRFV